MQLHLPVPLNSTFESGRIKRLTSNCFSLFNLGTHGNFVMHMSIRQSSCGIRLPQLNQSLVDLFMWAGTLPRNRRGSSLAVHLNQMIPKW